MSNKWQYHTLKGLSKCVCCLPYQNVVSIGRSLGPVISKILKKQRKRGIYHLIRGLKCSEAEANQIMDTLFRNIGQSVMEVLYSPRLTKENIREYVELDHPEYLEQALAENKGVVVLTAHIGNWEWMGASLALYGYPTTTIVKKQPNDQLTKILNEYREMAGIEVFSRGGNEMVGAARALKKKKLLGFLADQDGGFHGVPMEFLGKMSSTPVGPAVFSRRFQSPIVPIFTLHKPDGGHLVVIKEVIHFEDTGNEEEDIARMTRKMAKIIEDFIKEHPTEWLWFQHRWSTKPEEIIALQQQNQEVTDAEAHKRK